MSDPKNDKKRPSLARLAIWIGVGGVGLYLIISGIVGVIVKGQ